MRIEEIIQHKRDGRALGPAEIAAFVAAVSSGEASDAQVAAFTMATWFNGMDLAETTALTLAMRDSGRVMAWPGLDGPVLDKHSTGGVGDLVSLVLGPVVAACGGYVPMISGRGLGHTGGTLDKLESIPGFDVAPGVPRFRELVESIGLAIIGQSGELAPADRRIYAVRDVTATVSSPPLMISSILSKKLAEGLDGLVLDIKFGSGAFTEARSGAVELARQMSAVAAGAGVACNALVTDMDAPLARSAGNALEIREAAGFLLGEDTHPRLREVTLRLSGELLYLGGLATSADAGMTAALGCLESGRAAEKFESMVAAQGGPGNFLEHMDRHLPRTAIARPVIAEQEGYVTAIDTRAVGEIVILLGGGRQTMNQRIDHGVGIGDLRSPGDRLDKGAALGVIHAADEARWQAAASALHNAYRLGPDRPQLNSVVHECIEGARSNET